MRAPGRAGFTLIELVVVLVLVGLTVGLAIPFLGAGVDTLQGAAAGRRVVSFLNDARARAVNSASPVEVRYDFEERVFRQLAGKEEEKARLALPGGVRVTSLERAGETVEEGTGSFFFHPLGDSSGGTIRLVDGRERRYEITLGLLFAAPHLSKVRE